MFLYLFFKLMDKALEDTGKPHPVSKCSVCDNKDSVYYDTTYHCPKCRVSGITRIG